MIPALLQYLKMPQGDTRSTPSGAEPLYSMPPVEPGIPNMPPPENPLLRQLGELSQQRSALYSAPIEPPKLESGTLRPGQAGMHIGIATLLEALGKGAGMEYLKGVQFGAQQSADAKNKQNAQTYNAQNDFRSMQEKALNSQIDDTERQLYHENQIAVKNDQLRSANENRIGIERDRVAALASKLGTPDAARAQLEAFNRKIPEEFSYMRYTPEEVEAVVQGAKKTRDDKIAVAVQKASEDWRRYITSQTNSLNIAESPELAARFEAERVAKADSIATLYGLDNEERNAVLGALPQIKDAQSIGWARLEETVKRNGQNYGLAQDRVAILRQKLGLDAKRIAIAQGHLANAIRRTDLSEQRQAFYEAQSVYKELEKTSGETATKKKLEALNKEIAVLQATKDQGDPASRRSKTQKLNEKLAEKAYTLGVFREYMSMAGPMQEVAAMVGVQDPQQKVLDDAEKMVMSQQPQGQGERSMRAIQSQSSGRQTRAERNNNPLNIKRSGNTSKYPGVVGYEQKPAADGGNFLVFDSPESGWNGAVRLFKGPGYAKLNLDSALRRWSNNGYGADVARQAGLDPSRSVKSLSDEEAKRLLGYMARREGYRGALPTGTKAKAGPPAPTKAKKPSVNPSNFKYIGVRQ